MKNCLFVCFIIAAVFVVSSCATTTNDLRVIPTQGLRLVPIDYTVIGDTTAEATRTSILGVDWEHLFRDQYTQHISEESVGFLASIFGSLEMNAKKEALYKAIQKIPQADRLIEPRWNVQVKSFLLGSTVTVSVTAKAISYTRSNPVEK